MGKLIGNDFMLFMGTGSTKYPFAGSRTASFDTAFEKLDASSRDGIDILLGADKYTLAVDGLVDFTVTGNTRTTKTVMQIYKAKTPVNWVMALASGSTVPQIANTTLTYISGVAKISTLKLSSNYTGVVEYSVTLDAVGDWTVT